MWTHLELVKDFAVDCKRMSRAEYVGQIPREIVDEKKGIGKGGLKKQNP